MALPNLNPAAINLVVETQTILEGRNLGVCKFDSDGYTVVPMGVFGLVSRNQTFYETKSYADNLSNGRSIFSMFLKEGTLHGEMGHPSMVGLNTRQEQLARMCHIEEKNRSHHFRKVELGAALPTGGQLILSTIRPQGKYGEELKDALTNKYDNPSFSLRAITADQRLDNGVLFRQMLNLVTFDAVTAGGYKEASKRYAATENLVVLNDLKRHDFVNPNGETIAIEKFIIEDIDEMFGSFAIQVERTTIGLYTPGEASYVEDGRRKSFFHRFVK